MLFDTDVLIWVQRGSEKALSWLEREEIKNISIQTYCELMQGAKNKFQQRQTRSFIEQFDFKVISFSESIGHRAAIYIEEYALVCGMEVGDAIIAATAVEHDLMLVTANRKHFQPIKGLQLKIFHP